MAALFLVLKFGGAAIGKKAYHAAGPHAGVARAGLKVICTSCFHTLTDSAELERAKRENAVYFDFQKKQKDKSSA